MENESIKPSAESIDRELRWLTEVINWRIEVYFKAQGDEEKDIPIAPPELEGESFYTETIRSLELGIEERIVLATAVAIHVKPKIFDIFFAKNKNFDKTFTEFGGLTGHQHSGFIPTGETLSFLIAGNDLARRFHLFEYFSKDHPFRQLNILFLDNVANDEPLLNGAIKLSKEYLTYFLLSRPYKPDFNIQFPARLLQTPLEWDDLVIPLQLKQELDDVIQWMKNGMNIVDDYGISRFMKAGFRVLFHGPPGTGKTLTATLVGKSIGYDVYRIDLSSMVSKYIGETEKNLAHVFDIAENKPWILFFDEADALFGKRTKVSSSNDQHANQQLAYLLQRIENYAGPVILATNLKDNMDQAFIRRFETMIHFPKPTVEQKIQLFENYFSSFDTGEVDFMAMAERFDLTGANIANILRQCALELSRRKVKVLQSSDLIAAITKELSKEGVTI